MVREAYWQIGRHIVEDEQNSEKRAEYGKKFWMDLQRLTADFGKGFEPENYGECVNLICCFQNVRNFPDVIKVF